jgi:hypothetical protein
MLNYGQLIGRSVPVVWSIVVGCLIDGSKFSGRSWPAVWSIKVSCLVDLGQFLVDRILLFCRWQPVVRSIVASCLVDQCHLFG